ncbi:MAG: hypothetical protein U0746_18655 [Gemmataceae bacterium]
MEPEILVDTRLAACETIVRELNRKGFPVVDASWLKETDGKRWYLYLVSPVVDAKGSLAAYDELGQLFRDVAPAWVGPFDVKLVGTGHRVAKTIAELSHRYPVPGGARFREEVVFGGVPVDEALVYGPQLTP